MTRAHTLRRRLLALVTTAAAVTALGGQPARAQERTEWNEIRKGMSALLNEGWQIQSMTYNQILRREVLQPVMPGDGPALAATPDGLEYSFLLSRQGKWAVCVLLNPKPCDTTSRCRALN